MTQTRLNDRYHIKLSCTTITGLIETYIVERRFQFIHGYRVDLCITLLIVYFLLLYYQFFRTDVETRYQQLWREIRGFYTTPRSPVPPFITLPLLALKAIPIQLRTNPANLVLAEQSVSTSHNGQWRCIKEDTHTPEERNTRDWSLFHCWPGWCKDCTK